VPIPPPVATVIYRDLTGRGLLQPLTTGRSVSDPQVLELEQERVDSAYAIAEQLVIARDAPTPGATQKDAQDIHRRRQAQISRLRELLTDDARLFVRGRIDFAPDARAAGEVAGQTYYVGMAHLANLTEQEPVVVSWEAPLAKAFREPTKFHGGRAVSRTRTFEGHDRRITDIREQRFKAGRPEPGGVDPLLAALASRSGGQLHDVVATIVGEQFALMERPIDKTLVVQGGPGTGKTIVGLHRVSVMLFQSDGSLTDGDILVVGPSDVFMHYIEPVLPELGRGAVTQRSIDKIARHDVKISGTDRPAAREIKGRAIMAEVIAHYLDGRIGWQDDENLTIGGVTIARDDLETLLVPIRASSNPYNRRREELRAAMLDALGGARGDRRRASDTRGRGRAVAQRAPAEFENALNRLMETRSPREVVHELFSGPKLLARAADGLLTAEEQAAILHPSGPLRVRVWTRDDLPLLDEAAVQLDGVTSVGQRYLHIVVDEAQDLSPMQLRMLRRRLTRGAAMTVLGDLAQGTSPWAPADWEEHLGQAGIDVDEVAELRSSYRTTAPLLDFANRILSTIDVNIHPARSVIDNGDEPALIRVQDQNELRDWLVDVTQTLLPDDYPTSGIVAIIAADDHLRWISETFDDEGIDHTWAARSLDHPVTLVPADSAHGLEFDHVIVVEPEKLYRSDPIIGPRLLYVALTRARETATLLHLDRLPTVLTSPEGPRSTPAAGPEIDDATEPVPVQSSETLQAEQIAMPPEDVSDESVAWSWFHPLADASGLIRVSVTGTSALVEEVPANGGAGRSLATGSALTDGGTIAWALRREDKSVVAVQTSSDPATATREVVPLILPIE
jgi:DNA helicase IV